MRTTVAVDRGNRELNELIDRIAGGDGEVVLERDGKPVAMLVPAPADEDRALRRRELFDLITQLREFNKNVPPDVIEAEIAEAIREVRAGLPNT